MRRTYFYNFRTKSDSKNVTPQNNIKNLQGRSVVLGALCYLEDGRSCNVEVQKANDDNHEKRVRYNTSCISLQEIYVNTKIDDGSDIAELMHIFKEQNAYNFEKFPRISKRKEHFVGNEGGKEEMCEAINNLIKEEAEEIARKFFVKGADYVLVRDSIDVLSDEELRAIYEEVTQDCLKK